jgi:hypothetical protein
VGAARGPKAGLVTLRPVVVHPRGRLCVDDLVREILQFGRETLHVTAASEGSVSSLATMYTVQEVAVLSRPLCRVWVQNSDKNKTMLRLSEHRFILVSTSHNWKRMLPTGASLQFWDYYMYKTKTDGASFTRVLAAVESGAGVVS